MTNLRKNLINEVADLQEQGRDDEAQRLWEENTTPEQRQQFKDFVESNFQQLSDRIDWKKVQDILDRYRTARDNPDHPNALPWLGFNELTPRHLATFYDRLRDPRAVWGRPKGTGHVVSDAALLEEIERRDPATGEVKTVVREIIQKHGEPGSAELESRVNYLARLYRQRVKK